LQKAVQNPVANLVSIRLQNNLNMGYGSFNRTKDVRNIQPVIPIKLTENSTLVANSRSCGFFSERRTS